MTRGGHAAVWVVALALTSCTLDFDAPVPVRLGPICPPTAPAALGLEVVPLDVTGSANAGAALEDLDDDGDLDLVTCRGALAPGTTDVLETRSTDCSPAVVVDATATLLGPRTPTSSENAVAFLLVPLLDAHLDLLSADFNGDFGRALRGQAGTPLWSTSGSTFVPTGDGHLVGSGLSAGDLDGDGALDLVLDGYDGPPVDGQVLLTHGGALHSLGVVPSLLRVGRTWIADFDSDGEQEVLAIPADLTLGAHLLHIVGGALVDDTTLTNTSSLTGLIEVAVGDLDGDGDLDLFAIRDDPGYFRATLVENAGTEWIVHTRDALGGIGTEDLFNGGNTYPAFHAATADVDMDGRLDVLLDYEGHLQLLRNTSVRRASGVAYALERTDVSAAFGLPAHVGDHTTISVGDLEGDGDVDIVLAIAGAPLQLLRNTIGGVPWLRVRLRGPEGNTRGVGASVCVFAPGTLPASGCGGAGLVGMRAIHSNSAQAQALEASIATPGLGHVELRVVWPSGLGTTDLRGVRTARAILVTPP